MIDLRFAEQKSDLKKYLILLSFVPVVLFAGLGIISGFDNLKNNDAFIIYIILIGFTLPFLISKVLLKKEFISLHSVYCFLIYFATYLLTFVISRLGIVSIAQIYSLWGIVFVLFWHYLVYKYLKTKLIDEIDITITNIVMVLIPLGLFIVAMSFLRQYLALHSTDILVHKTVLNGMLEAKNFSVMPSNYSTTFTDQGYPIIIYHSVIFWMLNSFGLNFIKFAYSIDFVFSFLSSIVIFELVYKNFKKIIPSLAVVAITLLTFENLAYTTQFFIPQSFTLLLFLVILASGKLTLKKVVLSVLILVLSHFFIGAYLSVVLIGKYLVVDKKLFNSDKKLQLQWPLVVALLFTFALSFANFSVEKSFQQGMVNWVGMVTNPAFAEKTQNFINLWGINIVVVLVALLAFLFKKKKTNLEITAFIIASASFGAFYLGPSFAAKFLLGMGLCVGILIVSFVENLGFIKNKAKALILVLISLSFVFSYAIAYNQPLPFLTQQDGTVSAYVKKDADFIDFWTNTKPNCTLVSDPQTQQEIHTFSNGNTARGYYLTLEARTRIISFMTSPSNTKVERLLTIEELQDNSGPICFAISARLRELVDKNQIWTQNIFNYKIDHDGTLDPEDKAVKFLETNKFEELYRDSYFILFKIRN